MLRLVPFQTTYLGKMLLCTPSPPIKSFPTKSPWVKLSGRPPIKFNGHENSHPLELRVCLSQTLWNPNSQQVDRAYVLCLLFIQFAVCHFIQDMYIYIYIYTCTYIINKYMCICIHTYIHTYMCIHMYDAYLSLYIYIYIYMYIYIYIYTFSPSPKSFNPSPPVYKRFCIHLRCSLRCSEA